VQTENGEGRSDEYVTRMAIIATGYYDLPNLMGIPGEDLAKVSHYYTDPHPYYRRKVAVIGGANSAAVSALDLWRHGAEVTMIYRDPALVLTSNTGFCLTSKTVSRWLHSFLPAIRGEGDYFRVHYGATKRRGILHVENDFVFALTGYHPDFEFLRDIGVEIDPRHAAPPVRYRNAGKQRPGIYLAGVIIAGMDTNEIFIENGRFHGKQIITDALKKL